jgi:medium-chain acyl-[acyl-carrier-protein] hydrolase
MGALVAFELTRRLEAEGRSMPGRLIVSGCAAPQSPDTSPPIHALPRAEFLTALRRLGGVPAEEDADLIDLLLPALRADFEVCETYRYAPGAPLSCPITVFAGTEDPVASPEWTSLWAGQSRGAFRQLLFPGGHFFLHTAREAVAAALRSELSAVGGVSSEINRP